MFYILFSFAFGITMADKPGNLFGLILADVRMLPPKIFYICLQHISFGWMLFYLFYNAILVTEICILAIRYRPIKEIVITRTATNDISLWSIINKWFALHYLNPICIIRIDLGNFSITCRTPKDMPRIPYTT